MSIIYNTLTRLEMDGPSREETRAVARPSPPARKSLRMPIEAIATALVLVFTGTGLVALYWNAPLDETSGLEQELADQEVVVEETADHLPPAVPVDGQASSESLPAVQKSGTVAPAVRTSAAAEPPAVTPAKKPVVVAATDTVRQPEKTGASPIQTGAGEKLQAEAGMKTAKIKAPATNPGPGVKPAHKPQPAGQIAASNGSDESGKVNETLEKARRTLARGQYQQTLTVLETLAPVPEQHVDYWLLKGSAHLGLGQLDPAEEALASAQLLAPASAQIAVQRAVLKQEKGDHASALQILESVAARHPDMPEVCLNQGYSRLELGLVRDARRSFRDFLRLTEGRSLYAEQRKVINEWLAQFSSSRG